MQYKRIFLLVLDSVGVGEASDAEEYGDVGANTLQHIVEQTDLFIPNLKKIGLLNTLNMSEENDLDAYYTIAKPNNAGKDSLNGHYEMIGIASNIPFKTFNDGFPIEILNIIEEITGRRTLGNKCCNNSIDIINELGDIATNYGSLIIYTSADSDLQIAANEEIIPVTVLHEYCEKIREITLREEWRVGRVIARPFSGRMGNFKLSQAGRKDYAVQPPKETILNFLDENRYNVIGIGKINDIFDKVGINKIIKASNNNETINKLVSIMDKKFTGLCMANLSDFDSQFGHTRDVYGYAKALEEFDVNIPIILNKLDMNDLLIITADHGNDPTFKGNDHTRENVPVIIYSRNLLSPKRLKILSSLADIGATIADNFGVTPPEIGQSFLDELE